MGSGVEDAVADGPDDGVGDGVGDETVASESVDLGADCVGSGAGELVADGAGARVDAGVSDGAVASESAESAGWLAAPDRSPTLVAGTSAGEPAGDFVASSTVETEHAAAIRANPTIKAIIRATRPIFRRYSQLLENACGFPRINRIIGSA